MSTKKKGILKQPFNISVFGWYHKLTVLIIDLSSKKTGYFVNNQSPKTSRVNYYLFI